MNYTIPSRTTMYKGVEFRSELEAAWAAFFDLRDIKYEYEPLLNLPTWRPDFLITFNLYKENCAIYDVIGQEQVLVEIKPFTKQWTYDILKKIYDSTQDQGLMVILLGASPGVPIRTNVPDCYDRYTDWPRWSGCSSRGTDPEDDWIEAKNTVRWRP